ncbi:MFS transporter [Sphingobium nicotianae]|uniref:MFS transporter n=1 Tax=Sphingobium nicotianae TaxID=2782607 RepID=UPI0032D8E736
MAQQSIDTVLEQPVMGSYRWTLYLACGFLMMLEGYDAYVVSNLAAIIAKGLSIPIPQMGVVFTAQSAGMALGFYTVPMLADRIGRRNIIIIGAILFGVLTLMSAMVGTMQQFTIVRFLAFAALGGTMPTIVALNAEFMPAARRGKLVTWLFIAHGLGASVAGLLGPTIVAYHSWQAAFWAGGLLMLLFVPFLYLYLPESCRYLILRDPQDARIGQILRRIAPGLSFAPGTRFTTTETRTTGIPVADLFRDGRAPMTVLLWVAMGAALCVTATFTAWLPTYLHVLAGLPVATATRMTAVSAFGAIVGPILLTIMMKRLGMPLALMATLLLAFVAMTCLALVGGLPWLGWALGAAYGLLLIGSQAGLNGLVAASYPTSIRSTGIGWAGGVGRLTSMIGPGLGGIILAAGWGPWEIYPAIAAPLLMAAVAMLIFHWIRAGEPAVEADRTTGPGVAAAARH